MRQRSCREDRLRARRLHLPRLSARFARNDVLEGRGDTDAIFGIGGLGHLGVQSAAKMGFRTVAIARGSDKAPLAKQLDAHIFIDSADEDPAQALQKLGGAKTILATATNASAVDSVIGGPAVRGKLIVVGVSPEPMQVPSLASIGSSAGVMGHASGTSIESEDTLRISALTGIKPMIEVMPLEKRRRPISA